MKKRLQLMDLVRQVANELRESQETRNTNQPTVMRFVECEITASFQVDVDANGKVNLWVAELGTSSTQTTTHSIKLKYEAKTGDFVSDTYEVLR